MNKPKLLLRWWQVWRCTENNWRQQWTIVSVRTEVTSVNV